MVLTTTAEGVGVTNAGAFVGNMEATGRAVACGAEVGGRLGELVSGAREVGRCEGVGPFVVGALLAAVRDGATVGADVAGVTDEFWFAKGPVGAKETTVAFAGAAVGPAVLGTTVEFSPVVVGVPDGTTIVVVTGADVGENAAIAL